MPSGCGQVIIAGSVFGSGGALAGAAPARRRRAGRFEVVPRELAKTVADVDRAQLQRTRPRDVGHGQLGVGS